MLLNKFKRPSYYLGMLVIAWGIVMTCTGTVQNFSGLVAVRFFLGLAEYARAPSSVSYRGTFGANSSFQGGILPGRDSSHL